MFGADVASARLELQGWMAAEPVSATVRNPSEPGTLDELLEVVCRELGADASAVRDGRRTRADAAARKVVAHRARTELGLSEQAIASALGVSRQALWRRLHGKVDSGV